MEAGEPNNMSGWIFMGIGEAGTNKKTEVAHVMDEFATTTSMTG
jgi:hypothetical protein